MLGNRVFSIIDGGKGGYIFERKGKESSFSTHRRTPTSSGLKTNVMPKIIKLLKENTEELPGGIGKNYLVVVVFAHENFKSIGN